MTPEAKQRSEHLRIKAQGMLTLLASEFRIAVPYLKWQGQQRRGQAVLFGNEIRCGPNVWRGVENSILHEFAHILAYRREGRVVKHGIRFWAALRDVCGAWFGTGEEWKYGWAEEYAAGVAYGRRRGLLDRRAE